MYLPGASAVPANMLPHMTELAPKARALVMWPEFWMPPSAMMGTPCTRAYLAVWYTAVAWPRPTAQTSCVVQMDPEPMPTRRASAPAPMRLSAWREVTTFPAITCRPAKVFLMCLIISSWYTESPWLESKITASTPSFTSASSRTLSPSRVPTAQPTLSWPAAFVVGVPRGAGYLKSWSLRSDRSTTPASALPSPTTGRRPFLQDASAAFSSLSPSPRLPVTRSATGVITSPTVRSLLASAPRRSRSLVVTRPTRAPPRSPLSVTRTLGYLPAGRPRPSHASSTLRRVVEAETTRGSNWQPARGRWRLACRTAVACSSTVLL
mmetsp:Transcript_33614/g.72663  ORF Transcript_33614/g.72663 Transcript_33614/m.72663 type:complete len:322 (+) Transcript_33614:983-1948(+)